MEKRYTNQIMCPNKNNNVSNSNNNNLVLAKRVFGYDGGVTLSNAAIKTKNIAIAKIAQKLGKDKILVQ